MKVVLNKCFGGFSLSTKAVELCLERGMTYTLCNAEGNYITPNTDFALNPLLHVLHL